MYNFISLLLHGLISFLVTFITLLSLTSFSAIDYPFGDVLGAVSNGNQIGIIGFVACRMNSAGDLHLLVNVGGRLYHTICTADGNWPYPFGDVLGAVSNGNQIGIIGIFACRTNSAGDLHVLVNAY